MGVIQNIKIQKTAVPERLQALPRIKYKTYRRYRPEYNCPRTLTEISSLVLDGESLPKTLSWTPDDVANFVNKLGFPEYEEAFVQNYVNGRSFLLIEADKLPKLNLRNFENNLELTYAIRNVYKIDQEESKRRVNLPLRRPRTLYMWYKSRTGPTPYFTTLSGYLRKSKIIRDNPPDERKYYELLNHWNRIPTHREWCPRVLIGNITRINPMTRSPTTQNYYPRKGPYLLKDLCFYSLPCVTENNQLNTRRDVKRNVDMSCSN